MGSRNPLPKKLLEELKQKDLEATDLRSRNRELSEKLNIEIHQRRDDIADLDARLTKARDQEQTWRDEADRRSHEADSRLDMEKSAMDDKLRSKLSRPTQNLRDHVVALVENPGDSRRMLLLAVAFDNLQKKILEVTKDTSQARIPAELLNRRAAAE